MKPVPVEVKCVGKDEYERILNDWEDAIVIGTEKSIREYWFIGGLLGEECILLRLDSCQLSPKVYILRDDAIGIGINDKFYIIGGKDDIREVPLFFIFYELIYCDAGKLIIWDEIGFICVDYDGKRLWQKELRRKF